LDTAEDISRRYFELSNAAKLNDIAELFEVEATYSSDHTGLYFGLHDIMAMMTAFFQNHQSLHWQINQLRNLSDEMVEIEFTLQRTTAGGEQQTTQGIERLVINQGLIRHIEVRKP